MIKYIGSKRTLVPLIRAVAAQLPVRTACDLFAGTTRVGQALRSLGITVHSNDLATYSEVLGQAYIVARLWVKLVFWAGETSLFQARLAHAGYTARPEPAWPDSPAADAIRE